MQEVWAILAKSGAVSLAVALAVWIIDGFHIGFGWFAVLQLLISAFLLIMHVVKTQQTELKKPLK
jgi:hypothetical protein